MNAPDHSTTLPNGELASLVTKAAHIDAFVAALSRSGIIPNDNADVSYQRRKLRELNHE